MGRSISVRPPRCRLAVALSLLVLSLGAPAAAQDSDGQAEGGEVVLGPGHESAVLALFAPHALGDEIAPGFALWNLVIQPDAILVTARADDGREVMLRLTNAAHSDAPLRTPSFAVSETGATGEDADRARAALRELVEGNDPGAFWGRATAPTRRADAPPPRQVEEAPPLMRRAERWRERIWVPLDGLLVLLIVYLLAGLLAARLLAREPRWMAGALVGVTVVGGGLRALLSPFTFLGAWPWTRLYPHVRQVAEGSWVDVLAEQVGHPFFLTDVTFATNLAYAVVMPVVLFAHATYLMKNARVGLGAAAAIALLPQHIRFSACEDGFIASLVLTSLAFAVIHGWLRDERAGVRWLLLLALPFVLYPGYRIRPLNILFVVVYVGAVTLLHGETAPRWRRAVALAVVLLVGGHAAVELVQSNADVIAHVTTRWDLPLRMIYALVSPVQLVLTDPTRTPPALIVAAFIGARLTWAGDRRLALFLLGWIVLFAGMHATVMQETMQPRYHLHLVVPFLLLAGSAVPWLQERWGTHRRWIAAGLALTAAAPLVHLRFIRDLDFVEVRELSMVAGAREELPEGCTVLESTADERPSLRFRRIGALVGGDTDHRYEALGVRPDGTTTDGGTLDALLASPPACLALYEGLPCVTERTDEAQSEAAHCAALRERLDLDPISSVDAPARFYDVQNRGDGLEYAPSHVPLRLYRVRTRRAPPTR